MSRRALAPDQTLQLLERRRRGEPLKSLAAAFDVSLATVKAECRRAGVTVSKEVAAANARQALGEEHASRMRRGLTAASNERRAASLKSRYEDPSLRALKKRQAQDWWAGLAPNLKAAVEDYGHRKWVLE